MTPPEVKDEHAEKAAAFARSAAGDDDVAYLQLFCAAYNMAYRVAEADASSRQRVTSALLERVGEHPGGEEDALRAAAPPAPDPSSLWQDPVYVENQKLVVEDDLRIVGGQETAEFPDCVAVGAADRWCCTGTLVAPTVVVSAAHCPVKGGCSERVFVGEDVTKPEAGRVVNVQQTVVHPQYGQNGNFDDLTVLILAEEVGGVTPRMVAAPGALDQARSVRLVGYGHTDFDGSTGYGLRREVDVGLASSDPKYGARLETEFVAGAPFLDRDSCSGDSGGPAYLKVGGQWQLMGATSRATASAVRTCGDGGVYTRVPVYRDWIESIAGPLA